MKYIIIIIIGLLIGLLIGFKIKNPEYIVETEIEYVYDTIPKIIKEPYEVIIRDTIEVELPAIIDTVYVIENYFTKYTQSRLFEDEDFIVQITDTIFENKVVTGEFEYTILRPTTINTTTIHQHQKYITLEGLLPITSPLNPGLKLSYTDKYIYSITMRPKSVELGFGVKLFTW